MVKPKASYVLSNAEFEIFANCIESLKTPTGYSSDLGKHIRKKNFGGLKSHDYHILMQQILPLALRDLMKPGPRMAIMRMSKVFRRLCTKVYNPTDFASLEADVAESMALVEMEFPPSFFDIMTHHPYHLVQELDLCGPVSTRWMYPVERYMKTLKNYVRNYARPEACMAEGFLKDECIGFITEYLQTFDVTERRVWDADEEYGDAEEVLQGAGKPYVMTPALRDEAHRYVLSNISCMQEFYVNWKSKHDDDPNIQPLEEWVQNVVRNSDFNVTNQKEMDRLLLSTKPSQKATRYTRMTAYGNHFRVDDGDCSRFQTYNSGVASVFQVPTTGAWDVSVNYVGVLKDILELDYGPLHMPIILFRCEWIKTHDNRGNATYIRDDAGFLIVNFRHKLSRMSEPFIFANQATQVFYSDVPRKPGWKVVLSKEARAKREVVDTSNVFITTTMETSGLIAPEVVLPPPQVASLIGAIDLSAEDNLLAHAKY